MYLLTDVKHIMTYALLYISKSVVNMMINAQFQMYIKIIIVLTSEEHNNVQNCVHSIVKNR